MIFIDTGAFLARYLAADQHHEQARMGWQKLVQDKERCATSNLILDETCTLLARRAGCSFAAERARNILGSQALSILRPSEKHESEALRYFEKFADQEASFTDCVSFALMREAKIRKAFSFDRHFAQAGFELWPRHA